LTRKTRKKRKTPKEAAPITLAPLGFGEAVAALAKVKPPDKKRKKPLSKEELHKRGLEMVAAFDKAVTEEGFHIPGPDEPEAR
jgi:hypothetical protein